MTLDVELCLDVETSTKNTGNVYDSDNKLCSLVIKVTSKNSSDLLTFTSPWDVGRILDVLNSASLIIGFNCKFDLSWLRREFGFVPRTLCRIWDCQYAEYLFSAQTWKYPDLKTSCQNCGLDAKDDNVKINYWDKGIDTTEIPIDELLSYNVQDVEITHQLYRKQVEVFKEQQSSKYKLFRLHMLDLPVLLEMEWNGLKYNRDKSIAKSFELQDQIQGIEETLNSIAGIEIKWSSGDERSAFLYGGDITRKYNVPIGVFKSGARVGQVRYRSMENVIQLERRVEPIKGSEYAKGAVWSTDEPTLRSLKTTKQTKKVIDLILERAKLEKLRGTYLIGLPNIMDKMNWGDYLHPQYNQCVAVTGRISSSKPNGQNIPPIGKQLIESRYNASM